MISKDISLCNERGLFPKLSNLDLLMKVYLLNRNFNYGSQKRKEPIRCVLVIDVLVQYWPLTALGWQYCPTNSLTLVIVLWAPLRDSWENLLEAEQQLFFFLNETYTLIMAATIMQTSSISSFILLFLKFSHSNFFLK